MYKFQFIVQLDERTALNFCHCEEPTGDVAISAVKATSIVDLLKNVHWRLPRAQTPSQ